MIIIAYRTEEQKASLKTSGAQVIRNGRELRDWVTRDGNGPSKGVLAVAESLIQRNWRFPDATTICVPVTTAVDEGANSAYIKQLNQRTARFNP